MAQTSYTLLLHEGSVRITREIRFGGMWKCCKATVTLFNGLVEQWFPRRMENRMTEIVITGGDGLCGWAGFLHLPERGREVVMADNLSRRSIDVERDVESLTPIALVDKGLEAWHKAGSHE